MKIEILKNIAVTFTCYTIGPVLITFKYLIKHP